MDAIFSFVLGGAVLYALNKLSGYSNKDVDVILMFGICFLTVYAQFFSLFYKVGALASAVLLFVNVTIVFLLRKSIYSYCKELIKVMWKKKFIMCLLASAVVILLVLSSEPMAHYDTFLYHAQSIRWIEEYGVVPGLGNLHNRLAYNSSFFCLQALFSMKFLFNQSLHSVNGFVVLFLLIYALYSLKFFRDKKIYVSDFLRLGLVIFLNDKSNLYVISSPGSDILALGLVFYIVIKWVSYMETNEKNMAPYAYLCLIGVFAISVKLSAAMIILLTIIPAVKLIQKRNWKLISVYIVTGILIILPFLIRNVIISGYLIYPYPEFNIFNVDWKMPEFTLLFDRNEIKAWGWGLRDVMLFDTPFKEWFSIWYSELADGMKLLFVVNAIASVYALLRGIVKASRKEWEYLVIVSTFVACFLVWFCGAPLVRYGSIYLLLMPLFVIGEFFCEYWQKETLQFTLIVMLIAVISYNMYPIIQTALSTDWKYKRRGADYANFPCVCVEYKLGDEVIYVPETGDQAGYDSFPSTPYANKLNYIELRGESIKEGFRMKEEYRNAYISNSGWVLEENIFERK